MYFNLFYKNQTPTCDLLPNYHPPSELIIMVINRKLVLYPNQQKLLKKHDPVFFATEFPILATESTSGRELYEQVWMRVRGMLQLAVHDRNLLWWTDKAKAGKSQATGKPLAPFVLKHVDISGTSCSICHWTKRCHGCMIPPDENNASQLREVLLRNTYVACEWDIEFFDTYNDPKSMNCQDHQSVQEVGL